MDADQAQTIAVSALAFLAQDIQRLGRFLALTGIGPAELREQARTSRVQAAVLDHLSHDESLLLAFAATSAIAPQRIAEAQRVLEREAESEAR